MRSYADIISKRVGRKGRGLAVFYFYTFSNLIVSYASLIGKFLEWQFKGALSQYNFAAFLPKLTNLSSLTFTLAGYIASLFRTKA